MNDRLLENLVNLHDGHIEQYTRENRILCVSVVKWNGQRMEFVFNDTFFVWEMDATGTDLDSLIVREKDEYLDQAIDALRRLDCSDSEILSLRSFIFRDLDGQPVFCAVAGFCDIKTTDVSN
jgi:hypothetical protein